MELQSNNFYKYINKLNYLITKFLISSKFYIGELQTKKCDYLINFF